MRRLRKRRHDVEHDDVHRWLVSYADYMTLLFALFVVLYAMAMVNEKPFETITESVGQVFKGHQKNTLKRGYADDILYENTSKLNKRLFGEGILEETGAQLLDGKPLVSNISDTQEGNNLNSLEKELQVALSDSIESGLAKLQIDGDWLEIELNSALLFPSGSSSATNSAKDILNIIYEVIGEVSNFVRVRGYTDNQDINNEIFSSNWELSVVRATAILRELESLGLDSARMAIEGYGQYYPTADNSTVEGRAENRKVVIALSKYGLEKKDTAKIKAIGIQRIKEITESAGLNEQTDKVKVINLPNGGIRITTRNDNISQKSTQTNNTQDDSDN